MFQPYLFSPFSLLFNGTSCLNNHHQPFSHKDYVILLIDRIIFVYFLVWHPPVCAMVVEAIYYIQYAFLPVITFLCHTS